MALIKRFLTFLLVLGIGFSTPVYSNSEQGDNPKSFKQFLGEIKLSVFCMAFGLGVIKGVSWFENSRIEKGEEIVRKLAEEEQNDVQYTFIRNIPFAKLFTGLGKLNIFIGTVSIACSLLDLYRDCKSSKK